MAIVCLMTMVVLASCGNVDEDVTIACDKFEEFSKECYLTHAESDSDFLFECTTSKVKSSLKKEQVDSTIRAVYKDADVVLAKCFEPIFEKYGENETLEALMRFANTKTYKSITINSKKEFYSVCKQTILTNYTKIRDSKLELKLAEYKLEMIRKRF